LILEQLIQTGQISFKYHNLPEGTSQADAKTGEAAMQSSIFSFGGPMQIKKNQQ
jgi:hypothetical protein